MSGNRIGVITVVPVNGERGGAERFYEGLVAALRMRGAAVERVDVPSDESCFAAIEETYLRFYDLDLSGYDGVISTKAPAYVVRHPNHVCYLQHTMRAFYDMFHEEFPRPDRSLLEQRRLILTLDTQALRPPGTRTIFVIGKEVQDRLLRFNGLSSDVLHQGTTLEGFRCGEFRHVFLPGRLHRWKRVDLVIKAMRFVREPLKLLISGVGEDEAYFRSLAAGDDRIEFLGRVTDERLLELYADALAVPFVPVREDFGLVTLEAFHSGKPVITCVDSGEPAHIVRDGVSGFVCPAAPEAIGEKLEYFRRNPEAARAMGREGSRSVEGFTWDRVAETLIRALGVCV